MAGDKLVGTSLSTPSSYLEGTSIVYASVFQAIKAGLSGVFRLYSSVSGSVKCAIYSNAGGGYPGNLVYGDNTPRSVLNGWNDVVFEGASISNGTIYWLAVRQSANNICSFAFNSGGLVRSASLAWASNWPETLSWDSPFPPDYEILVAVHETAPVVAGTIGGILPNV